MNAQSSISVNLIANENRRMTKPLMAHKSAKFNNLWSALLKTCGVKVQRTYFVAKNKTEAQTEKYTTSLTALYLQKKDWSSNDIVRLQRGGIYEDDGTLQKLIAAGVFIEAYGHGDKPLIKTPNSFIEVENSSWF